MACYYFLAILPIFLTLLSPQQVLAQAPTPESPSGPANITGILDKNQQFTVLIRLLIANQVATQINSQLNSSTQGLTVFAPTDNAFNSLKAGTLNNLTTQQQVQLLLYHVVPQYYTLSSLLTVSNPVRTQASGQDGGSWGLNFTGSGTQVNVSTGIVETQLNNVLNKEFPLAMYQVDKVLLPSELFGPHHAAPPPPPSAKTPVSSSKNTTDDSPAPSSKNDSSGSNGGIGNAGFGVVLGFGMICMSVLVF